MRKFPITDLTSHARATLRGAALLAMELWPNAHLGTDTRRQDLRHAFLMIRQYNEHYHGDIYAAIAAVVEDAESHRDM